MLGQNPVMGSERADDVEERDRFLSLAQHKLKTPLAVIAGWGDALQKWELLEPDERVGGLAAIKRASDELRAQIDDLMAEARAHLLLGSLQAERLGLRAFVTDHVGSMHLDPDRHPVTVAIDPDIHVRADPTALQKVLAHLIDNAVTYSPDGGAIELAADLENGSVVLRVADNGIGLDGGDELFEPFRRGDRAAATARGTGLGLHVVRSLSRAMGGDVAARSTADGAVFEVTLPAG